MILPPTAQYQELSNIQAIAKRYWVNRLVAEVEKRIAELSLAERMNREGNALFSVRKYKEAITTYQSAFGNVGFDEMDSWMRAQIIRNIGVCHYELG